MLTLINILIFFFIFLIGYQIILANQPIREGATTYTEPTDPAVRAYNLSVENSGNISYLKQRVDKVDEIDRQVNDLSRRMDSLEKQMEEVALGTNEMAASLPGVSEPIEEPIDPLVTDETLIKEEEVIL
jgi:methyl-accepting chemotaxis protein